MLVIEFFRGMGVILLVQTILYCQNGADIQSVALIPVPIRDEIRVCGYVGILGHIPVAAQSGSNRRASWKPFVADSIAPLAKDGRWSRGFRLSTKVR